MIRQSIYFPKSKFTVPPNRIQRPDILILPRSKYWVFKMFEASTNIVNPSLFQKTLLFISRKASNLSVYWKEKNDVK